MTNIIKGEWIVDLSALTCRNISNKIIVAFEKHGEAIYSRIDYIPLYTLRKWSLTHEGSDNLRKIIIEAEDAFLEVYFENKLEKIGFPEELKDLEAEFPGIRR
jgi:hypothetical protein